MGNNNNLNNNGSPGADIMFQMEDDSLTQLGSVFQSAYQSIVGGSAQVRQKLINVLFFFSCSFSLSLSLCFVYLFGKTGYDIVSSILFATYTYFPRLVTRLFGTVAICSRAGGKFDSL